MSVITPLPIHPNATPERHASSAEAGVPGRSPASGQATGTAPGSAYIVAVEVAGKLAQHREAWAALAEVAAEPNVFLEPWQFLPAIEAFGAGKRSLFLLVFRKADSKDRPDEMIGFFPFEHRRGLHGIPARLLISWDHPHCFLGTPLLHRHWAREAWGAVLDWLQQRPGSAGIVEMRLQASDGASHHALVDAARERGLLTAADDSYSRAVVRWGKDAAEVLADAAANREWRRQRRRLGEHGRFEVRRLAAGEDAEPWIAAFLELEARGWKGRGGTALAMSEAETRYFRTICAGGARSGQLDMMGLYLDGVPIAMKCNFVSGNVAFTFKMAYDEAYRAYSPGVLLDIEFTEALQKQSAFDVVDSCAVHGHPTYRRLWHSGRGISHILLSTNWRGNLVLALLACLRSAKRSITSRRVERKSA
jgi:CelD/BcsL family acetyltransferase involved in cellulose biosynthesis